MERLKLQNAKQQDSEALFALKLLNCLFTGKEFVNGNPTSITNSKDKTRKATIKQLNPKRMEYMLKHLYLVATMNMHEMP